MKAYSLDLRERVLQDCDLGETTRGVATKYRVTQSWVRRLKQRRREHGEVAPRRAATSNRPVGRPMPINYTNWSTNSRMRRFEELRHRF